MMTQTLIVQLIVVLNSTNDLILLLRGHLQSDNKRRGTSPSPPLPPYLDRHGGHSSSPQKSSPFTPFKRFCTDNRGYNGRGRPC
ncbi:hypothetical protein HanXRQr2_Chr11g0512061 [Helianthus annuus]|uniref:Uncharacterized protein n=1 Tax=Helianthus annuus TaxID=4232 RepID=A0A9K3N1T5_HELAN|nr:hypothetical protein HanXRQr2_Chr11g0512061 [Helianthus annuus]KAJ0503071.1 hypothetical protein HanHA300_Chr11g0420081 [Helianthus annuus]KAJ0519037.1 hypothetical protein HanHA89_Chr11g0444131 [Helianthus annuus]KAJ0687034.1 hypothetical protein HanLR1_Chr11g0421391 [Helianthus annuus]